MRLPRFHLRTLMVAVAVVATIVARNSVRQNHMVARFGHYESMFRKARLRFEGLANEQVGIAEMLKHHRIPDGVHARVRGKLAGELRSYDRKVGRFRETSLRYARDAENHREIAGILERHRENPEGIDQSDLDFVEYWCRMQSPELSKTLDRFLRLDYAYLHSRFLGVAAEHRRAATHFQGQAAARAKLEKHYGALKREYERDRWRHWLLGVPEPPDWFSTPPL